MLVVTLISHGCPIHAVVAAFELDERTVRSWLHKAGNHAQQVHESMIGHQTIDLQQVQADEIRVKIQGKVLWMAMALMVLTRLWLGGVVSERRDMALARRLASQSRRIALNAPILLAVDGWKSYVCAFPNKAVSSTSPILNGSMPPFVNDSTVLPAIPWHVPRQLSMPPCSYSALSITSVHLLALCRGWH